MTICLAVTLCYIWNAADNLPSPAWLKVLLFTGQNSPSLTHCGLEASELLSLAAEALESNWVWLSSSCSSTAVFLLLLLSLCWSCSWKLSELTLAGLSLSLMWRQEQLVDRTLIFVQLLALKDWVYFNSLTWSDQFTMTSEKVREKCSRGAAEMLKEISF